MDKKNKKRVVSLVLAAVIAVLPLAGCSRQEEEELKEDILSENIFITETGEVLEKEKIMPTQEPDRGEGSDMQTSPEKTAPPKIQLVEPEQEQVITEEDQRVPMGKGLQLVFLGDSIFDTYRDGTGIPYLTSVACEADVYNLAIGGTCAALEADESAAFEEWTSTSLLGVVNAITGKIPTDVFEGKTAKEILDNPNVDFSHTDYFIIEYGMNDFLRATPLDSESGELYNLKTYAGALRYAVANLGDYAPDATIIVCSPNYAQFYNGDRMVGEGNMMNNGYGTLANYAGISNYVANEYQTLFLNAFQDLGIDSYTAEEYLEDGIHLTEAGRQRYAEALAKIILNYEETKNN